MNRNGHSPIVHAIVGFAAVLATVGTVSAAVLLPSHCCPGTDPNIAAERSTIKARSSDSASATYSITVIGSRNAA